MAAFKNMAGMRFGRLTVMEEFERRRSPAGKSAIYWKCQCSCGKEGWVSGAALRSRATQSCRCLMMENLRRGAGRTHGHCVKGSETSEYHSYRSMLGRCLDPSDRAYRNYGGRGISVHPPWVKSFAEFYKCIGPKPTPSHTIDRIDNSLGYFPNNVKWSTRREQNNNMRRTIKVSYQGRTVSLSQACELAGVEHQMMYNRMRDGRRTFEEAVESIAGGRN